MSVQFASTKHALGICDRCGFQYKLKELKVETVKGRATNIKTCPQCFDPDHPQLRVGEYPVHDPQALQDPRPDSAELATSRQVIIPVDGVYSFGRVGSVTIT